MPVLVKGARLCGHGDRVPARKDRTFTQTENAAHRTDHAVMGAIVARTWHLPLMWPRPSGCTTTFPA